MFGRFYLFPVTFKQSFLHPTESLFMPASVVAIATVLINISQYGVNHVGDWLGTTVMVLFWAYLAISVIASCGVYLVM